MRFYVVGEPFDGNKKPKTYLCGLFESKKTYTKSDFTRQLKAHDKHKLFANLDEAHVYANYIHSSRSEVDFITPIFGIELRETPDKMAYQETVHEVHKPPKRGSSHETILPVHYQEVPTKLIINSLTDVEYYKSRLPNVNFRYDQKSECCSF